MKKSLLIALVLIGLIVSIGGCTNNRLFNVRDVVYDMGFEALAIIDSYIDMEIDAAETSDKLREILDRFDELYLIGLPESFVHMDIIFIWANFPRRRSDEASLENLLRILEQS